MSSYFNIDFQKRKCYNEIEKNIFLLKKLLMKEDISSFFLLTFLLKNVIFSQIPSFFVR